MVARREDDGGRGGVSAVVAGDDESHDGVPRKLQREIIAQESAWHILQLHELRGLDFNAVNVAVVGVARYTVPFGLTADNLERLLTGQVFALFIVTVAAAEVALGLAIVITMYRNQGSVEVGEANTMRH